MRLKNFLVALVSTSAVAACASATEKPSPPTPWNYQINFQQIRTAISVDTVRVQAFKVGADTDCTTLVSKRRSAQPLPTPAADTNDTALCTMFEGPQAIETDYGEYSLLVTSKRGGADWLIGCSKVEVRAENPSPQPSIVVSLFDSASQSIPNTACASVASYCKKECTR
jgi:hypothetical protein